MNDRPNNASTLRRRHALAALASVPLAAGFHTAQAQTANELRSTPRQTLGPFYPRNASERPRATDADLLTVENGRVLSKGTPLYLTGRVLTARGVPVAGAVVEIWQCDANAVYHHPAGGAVNERDPHFQGYGTATTDAAGAFHFRTIQPVPYPGRTPHIHVRVAASGVQALPTQLYLDGHPGNARDFLYRQLDEAERAAVTLKLQPTQSAHPLAQATQFTAAVDLIVG
ncbi:MAG: protocatechuate 3,4-dioxygenase [Burkholderiaceae bacterium]|nr:protocatechuate 3,4-dioxygenase [Burkholderiaceae bacterium]